MAGRAINLVLSGVEDCILTGWNHHRAGYEHHQGDCLTGIRPVSAPGGPPGALPAEQIPAFIEKLPQLVRSGLT